MRAGYSEKTARQAAARLLSKVNIQERIRELTVEITEEVKIDAKWVLDKFIMLITHSSKLIAVKKFEYDKEKREKVWVKTGDYKIADPATAMRGLENLARIFGMNKDDLNILFGVKNDVEECSDEALLKIIANAAAEKRKELNADSAETRH